MSNKNKSNSENSNNNNNSNCGAISVKELLTVARSEAQTKIQSKTVDLSPRQILDKKVKAEKKVINKGEQIALAELNKDEDELLIFDVKSSSARDRLLIDLKYKAEYATLDTFNIELGSALGENGADLLTEKVAPITRTVSSFLGRARTNLFGEKK